MQRPLSTGESILVLFSDHVYEQRIDAQLMRLRTGSESCRFMWNENMPERGIVGDLIDRFIRDIS